MILVPPTFAADLLLMSVYHQMTPRDRFDGVPSDENPSLKSVSLHTIFELPNFFPDFNGFGPSQSLSLPQLTPFRALAGPSRRCLPVLRDLFELSTQTFTTQKVWDVHKIYREPVLLDPLC